MNQKVKSLTESDITEIKKIHAKHFSDLDFPDFLRGYLCAFTINDVNDDSIIIAGGVKLIAEAVILTNKDYPVRTRMSALLQTLDICTYVCRNTNPNLNQLHAFTKDEVYQKYMIENGFHLLPEQILVLDI